MPEQSLSTGAVFLSYASEDADAAARICEALRAAGVEVWFDRSELRGGDAWDSQIKKQIHDCALFVPVISAHTNARTRVISAANGISPRGGCRTWRMTRLSWCRW